ncbi:acyltransferase [Arthrobacter sp. I2-34]|uniref:Acyltransferase n=1 Tax=Arthrobacter hankyongi TaxID=2904801 RepID=A0ABS9LAG9_9MICC|nr:acyltransferase [Arthrobacter hankyongi]MCG2623686.1 acyltransferase [Arthrobacter hankyongi]
MKAPAARPPGPAAGASAVPAGRNYALDLLRIVSITGVIAIHAFGQIAGDDAARGTAGWLPAAVIDIGFIWVVPVFVMISGTLTLSLKAQLPGPRVFYRRRAVRLLPALVFWHLVYLLAVPALVSGRPLDAGQVAAEVFFNRVAPHLYFLWLILGLYLAAPPLARFLHRGSLRRAVLATAAVQLLFLAVFAVQAWNIETGGNWRFPWNILTQWIPYVGYFMAGWVLTQLLVSRNAAAAAGAAGAVLSIFNIWHWISRDKPLLLDVLAPTNYLGLGVTAASMCIFFSVFHLLRGWRPGDRTGRILRALSNASFGVFLCHYLVLLWLTFVVFPTPGVPTFALAALKFAIATVASFAISLAAARIPVLRAVF